MPLMGETVIFPLQMFGFLKIINCSRAQEKVLQKLGKTVETKDERFEQSASNFHQQQAEGHKLYKDLKNFLSAVKVMHESSKRVSETLQEIYSSKWDGHEELKAIVAVRVCWALQLFHSHPTLISASSQLLCPSKQENKGASSHCFLYSPDHRW